jgi:LAO/AO transport system kinase
VALSGQGVDELCARLREHRDVLERKGEFAELNRVHDLRRMHAYFLEVVQQRLHQRIGSIGLTEQLESQLAGGRGDPLAAARQLADAVLPGPRLVTE